MLNKITKFTLNSSVSIIHGLDLKLIIWHEFLENILPFKAEFQLSCRLFCCLYIVSHGAMEHTFQDSFIQQWCICQCPLVLSLCNFIHWFFDCLILWQQIHKQTPDCLWRQPWLAHTVYWQRKGDGVLESK